MGVMPPRWKMMPNAQCPMHPQLLTAPEDEKASKIQGPETGAWERRWAVAAAPARRVGSCTVSGEGSGST